MVFLVFDDVVCIVFEIEIIKFRVEVIDKDV